MNQLRYTSSQLSDIEAMVLLCKAKRLAYEKAQPQFWCYAGESGAILKGNGLKNC